MKQKILISDFKGLKMGYDTLGEIQVQENGIAQEELIKMRNEKSISEMSVNSDFKLSHEIYTVNMLEERNQFLKNNDV